MGYVFLIPGFVFLGCFLVFPFFKSLVRSFTDWNAFSPDFSFVGLKNYIELFHNDEYWAAIKVNLVFAVVSTLIQTTLGFLLAFAVYYMTPKWQQFYKVALYIPVVLPASVVAVMWKFMLNKDIGLVNTLLRLVGLDNLTHAWIGEKRNTGNRRSFTGYEIFCDPGCHETDQRFFRWDLLLSEQPGWRDDLSSPGNGIKPRII